MALLPLVIHLMTWEWQWQLQHHCRIYGTFTAATATAEGGEGLLMMIMENRRERELRQKDSTALERLSVRTSFPSRLFLPQKDIVMSVSV